MIEYLRKAVPTWVVFDSGEDDPPLCYCDGEFEALTIADALNENERLRAAVQAVRDLHCEVIDDEGHSWCEECADLSEGEMSEWPCPTRSAIDACQASDD